MRKKFILCVTAVCAVFLNACSERAYAPDASPEAPDVSYLTVHLRDAVTKGRPSAPLQTKSGGDEVIFLAGNMSYFVLLDGSSFSLADEYPSGLTRSDVSALADRVREIYLDTGTNGSSFDLTGFTACTKVGLPDHGGEIRLPASVTTVTMGCGSTEELYLYGVGEVSFEVDMDYSLGNVYVPYGYHGAPLSEVLSDAGVSLSGTVSQFSPAGAPADASANLETVDVFVFFKEGPRAGELEASARVRPGDVEATASLKVSTGRKEVLVLANMPASFTDGIGHRDDYPAAVKRYEWNTPGALIMDAVDSVDVQGPTASCSPVLVRWCTRVTLGSIINRLPASYGALQLQYIYLNQVNFASSGSEVHGASLAGAAAADAPWAAVLQQAGWGSALPLLSSGALNRSVGQGTMENMNLVLYGFPNAAAPAAAEDGTDQVTKLVIRASVGGKTCWYPIAFNGMERNKSYEINSLTLTRPGSDDENSYLSSSALEVSVTVRDWQTGVITGSYNGTVDADGNISF